MTLNLGDKVRDTVSGLVGIVISRSEYLHGCIRCGVQAQEVREGKPVEPVWVDEPQLELVESGAVKGFGQRLVEGVKALARTGGPREDAVRSSNPVR